LVITPPTYQADALLQLEAGKNSLALPESMSDLLGGNAPSTLAEIEIIKSRQILGRAVAELNLDWQVTPILQPVIGIITKGTIAPAQLPTVLLSYLQVPPNWVNQEIRLTKTGEKSYVLALPNGNTINGILDNVAASAEAGFAINVRQMRGDINQTYSIIHRSELASIKTLQVLCQFLNEGSKQVF
jgi:tyrosine-protein kinase Etk/Wzc